MLDSDDPKENLMRQSALHRDQLEEDVKLISERTQKIITNALIIGGALAASYFIISSFSSKPKKKKVKKIKLIQDNPEQVVVSEEPETPGIISQLGTALASQATVMLLGLAKEKLEEYMQSQAAKKAEDDNS